MRFSAVIHIEERTPPNCKTPLYTVWYNGEIVMECASTDEVRSLNIGELADIVAMCDMMCG